MGLKEHGCENVNWVRVVHDEGQMKGFYEHDDDRLLR